MPTPGTHVIVGASAAGVAAALAMRGAGHDGEIVLCDASTREPYERPPLSKELLGGEGIPLRPIAAGDLLAEHRIELSLGTPVSALDPGRRRVVLGDGTEVAADHVVLATGARARRPEVPGADLEGVLVLRDAEDAIAVSERLGGGGPLVVVGGGFIGLELAALAREHGIEVDVVEATPLPLERQLGPQMAGLMLRLHGDRGVRFHLGGSVARFAGASEVEQVVLGDGTALPARTVVVGIGVLPNDRLAREAGIDVRDGVPVDRYGRTSSPWVSATGDLAVRPSPWLPAPARVEHWNSAQSHGAAVGASVAGVPTTDDALPYFWSDQYGLTLQAFGRGLPGDRVVVRQGPDTTTFVGFWLGDDDRLRAVAGLGSPHDVRAGRTLIEAGAPVSAADLRDPGTDLRALAKAARRASAPAR